MASRAMFFRLIRESIVLTRRLARRCSYEKYKLFFYKKTTR